jgi:hypothetical protein
VQIARADPSRRRPATYRLNEEALIEDPKMIPYRTQESKESLPGIDLASVPCQLVRGGQNALPAMNKPTKSSQNRPLGLNGQAAATIDTFGQAPLVKPFHQSGETIAPGGLAKSFHQPGETISPNYLFDSRRGESAEGIDYVPGGEVVENPESPTTTTDSALLELANGLREILPDLDDPAIKRIFVACKANAPDCTLEDILYFAKTKEHALRTAKNPAGLLITSVPACVSANALSALRQRREREENRRQAAEQERAREQELLRIENEEYQRQQKLYARAGIELDAWPDDRRNALKDTITSDLLARHPEARRMDITACIRHLMVEHVAKTLTQTELQNSRTV